MTHAPQSRQQPAAAAGRARPRGQRLLGWMLLASALAPVLLTTSTLTGLGLDQNLPGPAALAAAALAVALPALGLAGILGGSLPAHGLALWCCSIGLLLAFPSYLPERREPATRIGLGYLSMPLETATRDEFVAFGLRLLSLVGSEAAPPTRAVRRAANDPDLEAAGGGLGEGLGEGMGEGMAEGMDDAAHSDPAPAPDRRASRIPYRGDAQSIVIALHVDGPRFGEELRFVFDTGATLTTITPEALERLGIAVPDDAPEVALRTAGGEIEARLVLLDAIWLDREVVEWVTAAVCESCAIAASDGLLGLNVSSHFRVSIDHETEAIEIVPRRGRRNQRLDIRPWLVLAAVLHGRGDGRLELSVDVANRSRRGIQGGLLEVQCPDERFTIRLDPIPAFGSVTHEASLPWGTPCEKFSVETLEANWQNDRF